MLLQVVNLHQADAGGIQRATHHDRVSSRSNRRADGALARIGGREPGRLHLRRVDIALPVVVSRERRAILRVQLQSRILQSTTDRQRWTERPHDHAIGASAFAADKPTNHDVITRIHKVARADVGQL